MKPIRIILACEFFYPDPSGSTPTDVSDLIRYIKDHYDDCEIDVITSNNFYQGTAPELPAEEDWDGVRITRISSPKSKGHGFVARAILGILFALRVRRELMRRESYDVLFIVTNPPAIGLAAHGYARRRRVPFVYLIHDLYPDLPVAMGKLPAESWITRWIHRAQASWLNSAGRIVVLGRCMKARLIRNYNVTPDQISVITNWSNTDSVPVLDQETPYRRDNDLTGFVVLYLGNFGVYMNFDQILEAAARLRETGPGISFVLVGEGIRKSEVTRRVEEMGLSNVRVLPKVPKAQVAEVMASCDVALIPLDPAMIGIGVPSKLYTTLASGRPVVAIVPSESEVAYALEESGAGVNTPHSVPDQLASTILDLYLQPDRVARMGHAARKAAENHYTLSRIADQYVSVFREVAKSKEEPEASRSIA